MGCEFSSLIWFAAIRGTKLVRENDSAKIKF